MDRTGTDLRVVKLRLVPRGELKPRIGNHGKRHWSKETSGNPEFGRLIGGRRTMLGKQYGPQATPMEGDGPHTNHGESSKRKEVQERRE